MEQLQSPTADSVKPSKNRTIQNHLGEDVAVKNADSLLLLCCLVSGLIDSTIYNGRNLSVMVTHGSSDARTIDQPTALSYRCKLVSRSLPLVQHMLLVSACSTPSEPNLLKAIRSLSDQVVRWATIPTNRTAGQSLWYRLSALSWEPLFFLVSAAT